MIILIAIILLSTASCINFNNPSYNSYDSIQFWHDIKLLKFTCGSLNESMVIDAPIGGVLKVSNIKTYLIPFEYTIDEYSLIGGSPTDTTNYYHNSLTRLCLGSNNLEFLLLSDLPLGYEIIMDSFEILGMDFLNGIPFTNIFYNGRYYPVYQLIENNEPRCVFLPEENSYNEIIPYRIWDDAQYNLTLNNEERIVYNLLIGLIGTNKITITQKSNSIRLITNKVTMFYGGPFYSADIIVDYPGSLTNELRIVIQSNQGMRVLDSIKPRDYDDLSLISVSNSDGKYYYTISFSVPPEISGSQVYKGVSNNFLGGLYLYDPVYPNSNLFIPIGL